MFLAPNLLLFTFALALYSSTIFVVTPMNAYIAHARGPQSLQRAMTLVYAGFWAGTIFSPSLGGWIGQTYGLRYVFGAAFFTFLLSTVTIGLLKSQPITPTAHGQSRYGALFRNRPFRHYLALGFVALFAIQIGLPLMPNFAQEVRGLDVASVGLFGSIGSLGTVLTNAIMGNRSSRRGLITALGIGVACMGVLLMAPGWPGMALAYLLRASYSLGHTMISAQASQLVAPTESGLAFGLAESAASAAMMAGPLLAGVLYEITPVLPFQVSLATIALSLALAWWRAPRPVVSPEAAPLAVAPDA
jgi:predicted MFS family arabinose efflux permease